MKILGIETSSSLFSVCLMEDKQLIHEIRKNRDAKSSGRDAGIFADTQRLLKSIHPDKIDVIVVSIGPGMFTSLRVGLGIAKGLAMAQNMPLVSVNTLDIIGNGLRFYEGRVLAVINAFHGEIYAAYYKNGDRLTDYLLLTPDELLMSLKVSRTNVDEPRTVIVGPGIDILNQAAFDLERSGGKLIESEIYRPVASQAVLLALPRIREQDFDKIDLLEPFYMKKTDAERNLTRNGRTK